jgi:hypothetical protein
MNMGLFSPNSCRNPYRIKFFLRIESYSLLAGRKESSWFFLAEKFPCALFCVGCIGWTLLFALISLSSGWEGPKGNKSSS